jgi:hypothetical protein
LARIYSLNELPIRGKCVCVCLHYRKISIKRKSKVLGYFSVKVPFLWPSTMNCLFFESTVWEKFGPSYKQIGLVWNKMREQCLLISKHNCQIVCTAFLKKCYVYLNLFLVETQIFDNLFGKCCWTIQVFAVFVGLYLAEFWKNNKIGLCVFSYVSKLKHSLIEWIFSFK